MPCSRRTTILMTAVITAALWAPVQAGVSIGIHHGGYHGHGAHIGYHGRHHRGHGYSGYRYRSHSGYGHHSGYRYRSHSGYRHHGYRHGYHGYYRPRVHPYRSTRTRSTTRVDPYPSPGHDTGHDVSSAAGTNGWGALIEGDARQALAAFSREARSRPADGAPKAGYALAAASAGDLDNGVRAMRRAFRYEPEALPELAHNLGAHATVDDLIADYEYDAGGGRAQPDAAFMIAALHLLNGRRAEAESAAARAAEAGDGSASLRNLRQALSADAGAAADDTAIRDDGVQSGSGDY